MREISHHTAGWNQSDRSNDFLGEQPRPIAALHVKELVAEYSALDLRRAFAQRLRQRDDRTADAKRHWLAKPWHISNFGVRAEYALQLVVVFTGRCELPRPNEVGADG